MKSILSKISAPLLVGSILALGALAFPGHADAGEQRFVFRLKSEVLTPPTQVADNGSEEGGTSGSGTPGGGSGTPSGGEGNGSGTPSEGGGDQAEGGEEPPAQRYLVMSYSGGHTLTCATDWTADYVEAHAAALAHGASGEGPATLTVKRNSDGGIGTIHAKNAWFDLMRSGTSAEAFPVSFPNRSTWTTPAYAADPHPADKPCSGGVGVDGPALESEPGATISETLTSITIR